MIDSMRSHGVRKDHALGEFVRTDEAVKKSGLVSLVSVSARNWCYLCGTVGRVAKGEIVEIANIHAVSM